MLEFGLEPFSIEVKFNIHVEVRLFNCFSRLCLIFAFKKFSEDCLPFPHLSFLLVCMLVESSGIIYACCWLLLIVGTQRGMDI